MENGGNLILSGQNIGHDLAANGSADDAHFFTNYLHAEYISDSIDEIYISGLSEEPISSEFNLFIMHETQTSPSAIAPCEGASAILVYFDSRHAAAIKYEGDYKLVYFALGLEGLQAASGNECVIRGKLIENIIQWFKYVPTKGDVNQDGEINIMDVLAAVNILLGNVDPTTCQSWAADCNGEGTVNIIDVIGIVNVVLGTGTCAPNSTAKISLPVLHYLQSLKPHISPKDFAQLMSFVNEIAIPHSYGLSQNYPNPFNHQTSIVFNLPKSERVHLNVYNVLGQEIQILVDDHMEAGYHTTPWDASDVASGIYFYRLTAGDFTQTKRMVLLK